MRILNDREKELLEKLQKASKKDNYFTLSLKFNDIEIEERVFPADKYTLRTLSETRTHFLMNDLIREVLKVYSEQEKIIQEEIKKEQMQKLWEEEEKKNSKK